MDPVAIANLLAALIPLGIKVYSEIEAANTGQLAPITDIITAANTGWVDVIAAAQAELAKVPVTN